MLLPVVADPPKGVEPNVEEVNPVAAGAPNDRTPVFGAPNILPPVAPKAGAVLLPKASGAAGVVAVTAAGLKSELAPPPPPPTAKGDEDAGLASCCCPNAPGAALNSGLAGGVRIFAPPLVLSGPEDVDGVANAKPPPNGTDGFEPNKLLVGVAALADAAGAGETAAVGALLLAPPNRLPPDDAPPNPNEVTGEAVPADDAVELAGAFAPKRLVPEAAPNNDDVPAASVALAPNTAGAALGTGG